MIVDNENYDHIEVFDYTGQLIACISDDEVILKNNCNVKFCETDIMFEETI